MTTNELKAKLRPVGALLIGYFAAPPVIGWVLTAHDSLLRNFTVSGIIQAGLGGAILYKLSGLKEPLGGELTARLGRFGQTREKVLELSGRISSAAGFASAAMLLLPPLAGMFPGSRVMTLVKFAVLGYILYSARVIWKLYEPFMAYVPPVQPDPAPAPEPPAAAAPRCAKCGQKIDASMKNCAFCGRPIPPAENLGTQH